MPIVRSQTEADTSLRGLDRAAAELVLASVPIAGGEREAELVVPEIHCAGCIARIERALKNLPDITEARVNLSTKRVRVRWRTSTPPPLIETLAALGFSAHAQEKGSDDRDDARSELLRALAVAGFGAMNIMLLSVSVWSGADASTRQIFHWLSALIALPTLAYSGRVFFRSAWRVLRHGQTNMDVPISIGVLTAFGLSLYETITHGQHAYFDAAVTLIFFLLTGRTLDHLMRERARSAVLGLARLAARSATVIGEDGVRAYVPVEHIQPGMVLSIAAGERIPVNARVIAGASSIDLSLLTGESAPVTARPGDDLVAGALNLSGALTVEATAAVHESFLAEMMRMMEAAESGRSFYRRIADRAARLYAPVVHLAALATLLGWWSLNGDFHHALTVAVAVLIITCPCALGLAVPMVHVAAARRLFAAGVMVKDGAALERLAEINAVIFDKTGTLTLDAPAIAFCEAMTGESPGIAAALAAHSKHPYARAIAHYAPPAHIEFEALREDAGAGVEGRAGGATYRLGQQAWASGNAEAPDDGAVVFTQNGAVLARFAFKAVLRPDVDAAIRALKQDRLSVEMLSGDHATPVTSLAAALDIPSQARVAPAEKAAYVAQRNTEGVKALMVGDGINDAPALLAAHASMAPASAADIGRNAADFVFLRPSLLAVPETIAVARRAAVLVRQNMILAIVYNIIAVPVAIAGLVTPLIAALAMSGSSILVVANALRLGSSGKIMRGRQ
ncbi:MAG: cadmium-translocating P-type ATPase [Caulobacteraceae bacterium]|nr:cadmium-translocating P-type ATPase [Caulobacteraceae bacterium]